MSSNGLKKFVSIGLSSLMVVSSISVYAVEAPVSPPLIMPISAQPDVVIAPPEYKETQKMMHGLNRIHRRNGRPYTPPF